MNKDIIVSAIGGLVGGFVIGFFVGKKVSDAQNRPMELDLSEDVVEDLLKTYSNSDESWDELVEKEHEQYFEPESLEYTPNKEAASIENDIRNEVEADSGDLDDSENLATEYDWSVENSADPNDYKEFYISHVGPSEDDPKWPYIISFDQFINEHNEYSKQTCTFLSGDSTLINEDEVVMDVHNAIGGNFMIEFMKDAFKDKNRVVFYVRNDLTSNDYEILWSDRGYGELYLDIV